MGAITPQSHQESFDVVLNNIQILCIEIGTEKCNQYYSEFADQEQFYIEPDYYRALYKYLEWRHNIETMNSPQYKKYSGSTPK